MSQPGLPWFLARLEEALRQGRTPDAAWLCEGRPEHLPLVQQALEQIQHLAPRLQPAETLVIAAPPLQPTLAGSSRRVGEAAAPPSYQILGVLGRGGMGVVYRANQTKLNRVVALKMILAGSHAAPEDQARFLTEAEAIAAIQHPGIVQVFDFGTYEGLPYLAMELCPGGSLAQKLAGTPLPPKDAADLVARMARAIQAAHDQGIVHRDLKPANILLAADGTPRITDFGLAKRVEADSHLTRTGALLGTPSYMAPEQAKASKHTGPAADIYALGAILYECLTGRPPFKGATAMETLQQVIETEPVSIRHLQPKVPRDLETICHKALHKEPPRRYATAADLAADLQRFLDGEPVRARPVGPVERGWKWVKRRPVVTGLVAAFVLSLVGGMVVSSRWALIARQRELLARQREQEVRDALDAAGRIAVLLASNVLAPIGPPELNREGQRNQGMSAAELAAIEELAELPRAIDRVELIRRILQNPTTTRKLSWRLQPVLRALVELNLERRDAVLGLVRPRILDDKADPVTRLVCARIFARLAGSDDPAARAAVGVLLDAVSGPLSPGERIAAVEDLAHVASHLSIDTADWLCGRLVVVARDAPPPTLELLASAYKGAFERLPAGRRRDALARELMERLTRQAGAEARELTLWHMLHAFAVVGVHLDRDEAARSVAHLVGLAEKRDRPGIVEAAGDVVRVLADKLDPAARRDADTRLAALALRLATTTTDGWYLDGLAHTLTVTLPGADAGPLAKPLADALAAKPNGQQLLALAEAFPAGAKRLPAAEASRLAAMCADLLAPLIATPGQPALRDRLVKAYAGAAGCLDSAAAQSRLALAVKLVETAADPEQLTLAAEVAGALAGRVPVAERLVILVRIDAALVVWLAMAPDPAAISRLGRTLAAVAPLEPARARRLAERLDREIGRLVPKAASPEQLALLVRGLGSVGPWLEEAARRRRVDEVTDRMKALVRPGSPLADLRAMHEAVQAVRPWIDPARLDKLDEAFAPAAVRLAAQDKWMSDMRELVERMLAPLPAAELVAILRQPSCIGPSEKAALRALGRRLGQEFNDVWEAVRWLGENRPDLDLQGGGGLATSLTRRFAAW